MTTLTDLPPDIAAYILKRWASQMSYEDYRRMINIIPSWFEMWREGKVPPRHRDTRNEFDLRVKFGARFWLKGADKAEEEEGE